MQREGFDQRKAKASDLVVVVVVVVLFTGFDMDK